MWRYGKDKRDENFRPEENTISSHMNMTIQQAYSGTEVADMLGQDPKVVYKTLVTVAKSKKNYVFVIPVEEELDLKKGSQSRQ